MRLTTVRYRNACKRGDRGRTGNTRHDLEWYSGLRKRLGFFGSPAENEWITAFETADILSFARLFDHEPMDMFLLKILFAGALADIDDFRLGIGFFKQVKIDQAIMKHNVGLVQARKTPHRDQIRIARARTHDVNGP